MTTSSITSQQDLSSILAQVKGLEEEKGKLMRMLEDERGRLRDVQARAEKMSESKRAEMRQALEGVIMRWLQDSVEDEKLREEFRSGMGRLVESTAEDSGVWQVVCSASNVHARHLEELERMRIENDALKTKAGGEFVDEGNRKRPREEGEQPANIWTEFETEIRSGRTFGAGL